MPKISKYFSHQSHRFDSGFDIFVPYAYARVEGKIYQLFSHFSFDSPEEKISSVAMV